MMKLLHTVLNDFTQSHCIDYDSFLIAAYAPIYEFFLFESNLFVYSHSNIYLVYIDNLC